MSKYIDAEKLKAEIERYKKGAAIARFDNAGENAEYFQGKVDTCGDLTHIITSLQQEQPANMIQWTGSNLQEVIDFTGKSPRFGEWFNSWEEYENYVHAHNDILKLFCEDGSHFEVPVGAWIIKTPDGYNVPSVAKFIHAKQEQPEVDLEKAAEQYSQNILAGGEDMFDAIADGFRASAEWMAGQGVTKEAVITRATELTKNLSKSGLDEDSIPYHLIEFMCNLYTCPNWKEIEETAEAYVTRIKAAAMKDLPRWKKAAASFGNYTVAPTETGALCILIDGHYIMLSELTKLPGFNE